MSNCPFCNYEKPYWSTKNTIAVFDNYPVTPDHMLVIPKRHVSRYGDLDAEEVRGLWTTVHSAMAYLASQDCGISGFNIGINDGKTAGQTVPHVHVHVIPRREGDCEDPRGGIRWVFPDKAKYW